jgi:hypothetical protein
MGRLVHTGYGSSSLVAQSSTILPGRGREEIKGSNKGKWDKASTRSRGVGDDFSFSNFETSTLNRTGDVT